MNISEQTIAGAARGASEVSPNAFPKLMRMFERSNLAAVSQHVDPSADQQE